MGAAEYRVGGRGRLRGGAEPLVPAARDRFYSEGCALEPGGDLREALPKTQGEDADIAQNRRVEFHIIRLDPPETELDLRELQHAPWNGGELNLTLPEPKKPEPKEIDNALDLSVDDFLELTPAPTPDESATPDSEEPTP